MAEIDAAAVAFGHALAEALAPRPDCLDCDGTGMGKSECCDEWPEDCCCRPEEKRPVRCRHCAGSGKASR